MASSGVADDGNDNSLTSLNLTIAMSFFGLLWAICVYVVDTKWKCLGGKSLWQHQLKPLVKPIWERRIYPILKEFCFAVCCSWCYRHRKEQERCALIGAADEENRSNYGGTLVEEGTNSTGIGRETEHDSSSDEANGNIRSTRNGYTSLSTASGRNSEDREIIDDQLDEVNYQANEETDQRIRARDEDGEEDLERGIVGEQADDDEPKDDSKPPLLSSRSVILLFSITQILARPFIIAVNIAYLVLFHTAEYNGLYESGLWGNTYNMLLQETSLLVFSPISNAIYWTCCWNQCRKENSFRRFLEFMRFGDLVFVILLAPFSNLHFYVLGGWWYLGLIVRLFFYGITFAAGVVAGIRFVIACFCKVLLSGGCDNDVLEIRNLNHLLLEVGLKLIPIFLKINVSSSALATVVKLVHHGGYNFRMAYFSVSLIRSITALFSLGFSGAMLRWAVLKQEHKLTDQKKLTRMLRFMDKYQPHVHISFFFDAFCYFSLIVLNLILLELVTEVNPD